MIGKAYWAIFKYYDSFSHKMAFKKRPVLIIGQADEGNRITDFREEYPDAYISVLALVEEFQRDLINRAF